MPRSRFAIALLACFPLTAFAHHGQEFLLTESSTIPHAGDAYFLANAEFGTGGEIEFEPSLLWSPGSRWALELHAHELREPGEGWRYEATAPAIHVLLSDPGQHDGVKVGLSAEYEIARERDEPDNVEVRLSVQSRARSWTWAANLVAVKSEGEDLDLGYAFGARHPLSARWSGTIEARGAFERAEDAELLGGLVWEQDQGLAFKVGLGAERAEDGYDPVLHLGVVVGLGGE